jgi:hypothetical protein
MKRRTRRKDRRTLARAADRYALYQEAVQDGEADVLFLERVFRKAYGRAPRVLREDFGGTALLACEWVRHHPENRAVAIDLDPEPLAWGRAHNLPRLSADERARLRLVRGDVRTAKSEPADVTAAFNFSYFLFKTRPELLAYFRKAHSTLRREGMLALDVYGGWEALKSQRERRRNRGFTYVWDQHDFDPLSHDVVNHIDFEFPDGSRKPRAFTYHWRLWLIPELRELLTEAGFRDVGVYWEGTDLERNVPNGVFTRRRRGPPDPAWIAYVIALR